MKGWKDKDIAKLKVVGVAQAKEAKTTRYKAQWLTIGDKRCYFRSKWEANYARVMQFEKELGLIKEWEHEPDTFWFENIKRGVRSYLPDFKITLKNGSVEYHEVKGYMDPRSKTKINRFRKYYPQYKLTVITGEWFKANKGTFSKIIKGWD